VPQGEDFDAASLGIDLVIEVMASSAEEKPPNAFLLCVASLRPDARLRRNEFEGSLKVVGESKRGCGTVGSPPCRSPPDLCRRARGRLDEQAFRQGLLAKFPEEGVCINEPPLGCLLEGLFKGDILVGGQLERFVGFRNEDSNCGSLLEGVTVEFQLAVNHLGGCDAHAADSSKSLSVRRRIALPNGSAFSCEAQRLRASPGTPEL